MANHRRLAQHLGDLGPSNPSIVQLAELAINLAGQRRRSSSMTRELAPGERAIDDANKPTSRNLGILDHEQVCIAFV